MQCSNKCGAFPERQKLDDHVEKECPLTVVECDFHYAGCEVRLPRRNMPEHLKDGLAAHFSLLAVSHKQQQEEIQVYQKKIIALERRQEEEMKVMRGEIDELKKQTEQLRSNMQIIPIDFRVKNPMKCTMSQPWSSPPFYTHNQGYKLRINFFPDLLYSFYIIHCYLIQGEFDDLLKWPLIAVMQVALVNQQPQGRDHEFNIQLKGSKPLGDNIVNCGNCSLGSIILDPYLRSGCLHIRIVSIQL